MAIKDLLSAESKNEVRLLEAFLTDEQFIRLHYRMRTGKKLNLENPKTFNEKMQWLKLNDRREIYTTFADKYEAKKYVGNLIGEKYINPVYGIWNSFDEIDFDSLPDKFVLKVTHDSGGVVICRDKASFDMKKARKKITRRLKMNYYWVGREWQYKNVKPRVFAEKYMEDFDGGNDLTDYKIHCYNGHPRVVQVIYDRFAPDGMKNDHYTLDWEKLDLVRGHYSKSDHKLERPEEMDEMLQIADKLCADYPYIRVDLYLAKHKIYFGELTLFPASGMNPFTPSSYDDLFGSWIDLTKVK
ncbi:MAG: glycosyl transferase [Lachnospiraceae bacterium]|nr:glycosyl transferase [Lachnospiraceae bacterium]